MHWLGYAFTTPVKSVLITGNFLVADGMQATVTLADSLPNISTRTSVQTGEHVLIGGFIITGDDPKTVLIRGIGPSLAGAGLAETLSDPTLELHSGNVILARNNNWKESQAAAVEATGIPPKNDLEAAIIATLAPGAYTAILAGKDAGSGVGLVEVYDLTQGASSNLSNISTRGFVQTGDNVMIGGFILTETTRVLVRALGPSLARANISDPLMNPLLELRGPNGTLIAANDDWMETQRAEVEATGIPPTDERESAILQALPPGNYTALVRGRNDAIGTALVEVYTR